jgi:hypothetical protein
MNLLRIIFISSTLLFSCKNKPEKQNEDFNAFGFISRKDELKLTKDYYMETYRFHMILFTYHDSIFQFELKNNQPLFYYLKVGQKATNDLMSKLEPYRKTTLKEQLKSTSEVNVSSSCGPEGYFLFSQNLTFGIFDYSVYLDLHRSLRVGKKIPLKPHQFPKIFQTIYHTMNSNHWEYYMSDEYVYRNIRIYRKAHLFPQTNK